MSGRATRGSRTHVLAPLAPSRRVPWRARLAREAIPTANDDFDLLLHVSLRPAFPPEYDVPGLVALTFRLRPRERGGGHHYVTVIDVAAALRLGQRFGLDAAESLAFVDSHERMHVYLQLAGVPEEVEEAHSKFVDAVWLSFRHPRAAQLVAAGEGGLVVRVHEGFWEELVDQRKE